MYDFLLGGTDNFRPDRDACRQLLTMAPNAREAARVNREFLERVVHFLAASGIRQFVDCGAGLPARRNVHQIAQRVAPSSRVVYVDNDPHVLAQGRLMLETNRRTTMLGSDIRRWRNLLERPAFARLIDLGQPIAVLFVSVLHCIPEEDDPRSIVHGFAESLAPGSFVVTCQLVSDEGALRDRVTDFMVRTIPGGWGRVCSRQEVRRYFTSARMQIMDQICEVSRWRSDGEGPLLGDVGQGLMCFGGVARIV